MVVFRSILIQIFLALKWHQYLLFFVAESSFLPTSHTTQAQLCSPHVRQISPKAATKTKKWRRAEKDSLYNLVHAGFIDIGDLSLDNIKTVHQEYFTIAL